METQVLHFVNTVTYWWNRHPVCPSSSRRVPVSPPVACEPRLGVVEALVAGSAAGNTSNDAVRSTHHILRSRGKYGTELAKSSTECSVSRAWRSQHTLSPLPGRDRSRDTAGCRSFGRQGEIVSKLATARESCYGKSGYPPGWPGRYTSGSRSDKRQEPITSYKQRILWQRLRTSCAPRFAGLDSP